MNKEEIDNKDFEIDTMKTAIAYLFDWMNSLEYTVNELKNINISGEV